jgi:thioredoxin 1
VAESVAGSLGFLECGMVRVMEITDANFNKEVIQANGAVLVDFGADWCHPCRQLDPIVEDLAQEWKDRVKVHRINIDTNASTTMQMGVMSVPTLILFIDGEPVERIIGYQPKKRILERLGPHLGI